MLSYVSAFFVFGIASAWAVPTTTDHIPQELFCAGEADMGIESGGKIRFIIHEKKAAEAPELVWVAQKADTEEQQEVLHMPTSYILRDDGGSFKMIGYISDSAHPELLVYELNLLPYCPTCPAVFSVSDTQGFRRQFLPNCTHTEP